MQELRELTHALSFSSVRPVILKYHRYTLHEFLHKRLDDSEMGYKYESAHSIAFPKPPTHAP